MRFYFLFFIFAFLLSLNLVSADFSLDKGKLNFNLEKGVEECQIVKVTSEDYNGDFDIRDIWPEVGEEDSSFNKYTLTAGDYNIDITHLDSISDFNNEVEVEVCLSGSSVGEYKGALIFTPEAGDEQVNVVVEKGVWLLVNVVEKVAPPVNNGGNSGSSGTSGGSSNVVTTTTQEIPREVMGGDADSDVELENVDDIGADMDELFGEGEIEPNEGEGKSWITGGVVGVGGRMGVGIIITIVVVLIVGSVLIYRKRGNRKGEGDGVGVDEEKEEGDELNNE
jgi:hypothetical protein